MTFIQVIAKEDHPSIAARYKHGETLKQIGDDFGVSRERIRQIVSRLGVKSDAGGASIRAFVKACGKERIYKAEAACIAAYGCSIEVRKQINGEKLASDKTSPGFRFCEQRKNAKARGIGWEITLPEWWAVWQDSGRWAQRGRGDGYVMTRIGDTGPYHKDNVAIKTQSENSIESYLKVTAAERVAKRFLHMVKKDVCIHGHARTPENLTQSGNCRICSKAASIRAYSKKVALKYMQAAA